MAKMNAKLEKKEEKVHKDLDGDGEKGEPAAHKAKVLGGKKGMPPAFVKGGKGKKSRVVA